jgi:hypothetical protein
MFAEYQDAEAAVLLQELFHQMEEKEMDNDEEIVEEMLVENSPHNVKGAGRKPKRYSDVMSEKTIKLRFNSLDELLLEGTTHRCLFFIYYVLVDDPELVLAWHLANISDVNKTLIALGKFFYITNPLIFREKCG